MKPSIPDTGTVIRLEREKAIIRMNGHESCRKCGAAAIGLCKGGMMREVIAKNAKQARAGDTVKIGLEQTIQYQGYFLAYVIPPAALLLGFAAGHVLGEYAGLPGLDVFAGFFSMIAISFFSFRRLKRLDSSHSLEIVDVVSRARHAGSQDVAEETALDYYRLYY